MTLNVILLIYFNFTNDSTLESCVSLPQDGCLFLWYLMRVRVLIYRIKRLSENFNSLSKSIPSKQSIKYLKLILKHIQQIAHLSEYISKVSPFYQIASLRQTQMKWYEQQTPIVIHSLKKIVNDQEKLDRCSTKDVSYLRIFSIHSLGFGVD